MVVVAEEEMQTLVQHVCTLYDMLPVLDSICPCLPCDHIPGCNQLSDTGPGVDLHGALCIPVLREQRL